MRPAVSFMPHMLFSIYTNNLLCDNEAKAGRS